MATFRTQGPSLLNGIHVLDGGFATELEFRGANISGPLWSAHVLEDQPELVLAVHRAYIEAGADCIASCSYQVSRKGYIEYGLTAERADEALLLSVELAREAAAAFPQRRVLVAASLGPYGAALHNGAEYHGNYEISFEELVQFHRERIQVLAEACGNQAPDLLAFETFPSLEEARAVCEALKPWPKLQAWFSFTCQDERTVAHGEPLRDCAAALDRVPQIIAIGVNCVPSHQVPSLINELRAATGKPLLVYPNSGEGWDPVGRCWKGESDPLAFGQLARQWFAAGVQIIGGCCRTRPAHISEVASAARTVFPA